MSRHGYSDDCDDDLALGRWRGRIASATRGKRGQAFFRALAEALDSMPAKRLVVGELETREGEVCALGCLGKAMGADFSSVDTEDWDKLGGLFNITPGLAQEVMYVNDEHGRYNTTPEQRWGIVREWVARQIKADAAAPLAG
jgi:hypothetical protein